MKNGTFTENLQANHWDNLRASTFTGYSILSLRTTSSFDAPLCAQPTAVRADNGNGRR